jgi:RHS repeat-associated protein
VITAQYFPEGEILGGTNYFYAFDHLSSVVSMTDSGGNVKAQYSYDPYGRITKNYETVPSDFQYAGYFVHEPSGLGLTVCRAYSSEVGRFINRDPALGRGGQNLFAYALNSPVNNSDPTGLYPMTQLRRLLYDKCNSPCCCNSPKDNEDCKREADKIADAFEKVWAATEKRNGPLTMIPGNVKGYMCWDWANEFNKIIQGLDTNVWVQSYREFEGILKPNGWVDVHFAVRLAIHGRQNCSVTVDDGFQMAPGANVGEVHDPFNVPTPWHEVLPPEETDPNKLRLRLPVIPILY